jgi:SAM-dependent methyltransferase
VHDDLSDLPKTYEEHTPNLFPSSHVKGIIKGSLVPKKQDNHREIMNYANEKSSGLPEMLDRVAKSVESLLNSLGNNVTQASIDYLRYCYKQPLCPKIDYDHLAIPFAHSYFLENFWKSAITFQRETPMLARHIVDAGCGSCTTVLAYLASLEAYLSDTSWKTDVVLIDRSKTQLDLGKRILRCAFKEFRHLEIIPHFLCIDLKRWKPKRQSTDVILFGHVLNENRSRVEPLLDKAFSAVRDNGRIYIIERKNDSIWHAINDYVNKSAIPTRYGTTKLDTRQKNIRFQILSKDRIVTNYLVLRFPERKDFAQLLRRYFLAWRTRSPKIIEEIFDSNAEYYEKPFDPPLQGIKHIKKYWKEEVLCQQNVHIRILRVAYAGNNIFAEWEAHLTRQNKKMQIRGVLIMDIDPKSARIKTLREYYQSCKKFKK